MIGVTFPSAGGQSGSNYNVPEPGDVNTQSLTDYLVQVASQALALPASADLDLGAAFGIKSLYFKTRTANPAASGVVRNALSDTIAWRNNANNGDLPLAINGNDQLLFNSKIISRGAPAAVKAAGAAVYGSCALDSSGTVTVSTTAVVTGSLILCWMITAGGAVGGLYRAAAADITNGVSFIIRSFVASTAGAVTAATTDTSTVGWWIIS